MYYYLYTINTSSSEKTQVALFAVELSGGDEHSRGFAFEYQSTNLQETADWASRI